MRTAYVQANPTKLELLACEFNTCKDTFMETKKESIIREEHLEVLPKQLLLDPTADCQQANCGDSCLSTVH